jgi:lon-related putative ATP-dependent protease
LNTDSLLPLDVARVYKDCLLDSKSCTSTKSLAPLNEIVGQARAQEAVRFAVAMRDTGYNIYALGRNGLGKRTMVVRYLAQNLVRSSAVFDWCYVANFDEPRSPRVLRLPVGMGMLNLVKAIPRAFDNDSYFERSEKLKNEYTVRQEEALEKLARQARRKHIKLTITTPGGYRLSAMAGDEPHTVDSFNALSEEDQQKFEQNINKLETRLRNVLRKLAAWEQEFSDKQDALHEEIVNGVSSHLIAILTGKYATQPEVVRYLETIKQDIVANLDIFLEEKEEQEALASATLSKKLPRRYQVNVLVHHESTREPVVVEENPNYHTLFGYVENVTYKGTVFTDYTLIQAGCLHRANGGYLLMDATKVLEQPFVWDSLKRALRSKELHINALERELTLSGTISLEPEAIPLDIKIVLFGDRETYMLLQRYDPEFSELFKITADFENEMPRTPDSELHYAQFISSLVHEKGFRHCDRHAIARIIEYSSRQAEDQTKLSLHASNIANLLRESNYWAKEQRSKMIRAQHVERALDSQRLRVSRLKDQMFDSIRTGATLLTVSGSVVGQINALSVLSTGDHDFGMPNRVTANCFAGHGAITDVERDSKLGGSIHTKGVMILSSFLCAMFAAEQSMPLSASIAFEQSYGEVDGDSASLAELCALISSLSGMPIQQRFAVTGSVNQFGEVQPVGGVNEKIEGYFDACSILGLDGHQAVIVPATNVSNLMLDRTVRDAMVHRRFAIHAVRTVSEALTLLMGEHPGERLADGSFTPDSCFARIHQQFRRVRALQNDTDKQDDEESND